MNAKIMCLASAKGGSGKTSLVATIGTFLSQLNKSVLMIDADFGTSGLTLLYLKEVRMTAELVTASSASPTGLLKGLSKSHCDVVKLSESLHLVPADFYLASHGIRIDETALVSAMRKILTQFRDVYDYILIDAQAGSDSMARASMDRSVSDEVVIVTEYDPMSAAGVERLKAILREDLTYDRTWVLLNKILPEFAKSFSDFLSVAKYLSPIPWDAEVVRAYSRRQLAINTGTGNDYTLTVLQTIKNLFGDEIKSELAVWIKTRAAEVRQPILEQYEDAERELAALLEIKLRVHAYKKRSLFFAIGTIMLALTSFGISMFYLDNIQLRKLFGPTSDILILIVLLALATFVSGQAIKKWASSKSVDSQISDSRVERQLEAINEKLKRLEVLRAMDAERLLGSKSISVGR